MLAGRQILETSSCSSVSTIIATEIPLSTIQKHLDQITLLGTASSTRKVYQHACEIFENFLLCWSLMHIEFDKQITLFISFLSISDLASSTIATYVSTIKGKYCLMGIEVQNEFLLSHMLKGIQKFNRGPWLQRCPFTLQMIKKIFAKLDWTTLNQNW